MKTTIDIADGLLEEAKAACAQDGMTLRALVEAGLRRVLAERKKRPKKRAMRDARVKGKGITPDLEGAPWEAVRERIYDGRGGRGA